jgi:chaperonin GroES
MARLISRIVTALPMTLLLCGIGAESFADTDLRRLAIYNNFRAIVDASPSESAVIYVAPTAPPRAPSTVREDPWLGARVYDQAGNVVGDIPPVAVANGGFRSWKIEFACGSSNTCEVYVHNRDGSGPTLLPGHAQIVGSRPVVLLRLTCAMPCRAQDVSTLVATQDAAGQTVSLDGEELLVMKESDILGIIEGDTN